jgi:CTP:molybdopterin cytidylyltransferase MocA/molybdopterin converting factor small subunit
MGRPKLLLPIEGQTLIARVVTALRDGGAHRVVVVAPPAASFEGPAIALEARAAGAVVVAPEQRPAEMRDSIEIGLATVAQPAPPGHVLLSPGDAPGITPRVVALLIEQSARQPEKIVVPRCGARRGHPLVLPWNLAADVASLPAGQGLNALVARNQGLVEEITVGDARVADDIDCIEDYRRWEKPQDEPAPGARALVKFFALARERACCSELELDITPGCRVSDIRAQVARLLPDLAPLMKTVMIAVNEEYADDEMQVFPGARIAVIPPVSGGAGELTGGLHRS